ncbi:hypothetical protein C8R45DRAFT_1083595 [Mycena sanguinolenta]|nr:hypothetical protein C8R45DRAFT_1083595 [Mycena sanguinolenta]
MGENHLNRREDLESHILIVDLARDESELTELTNDTITLNPGQLERKVRRRREQGSSRTHLEYISDYENVSNVDGSETSDRDKEQAKRNGVRINPTTERDEFHEEIPASKGSHRRRGKFEHRIFAPVSLVSTTQYIASRGVGDAPYGSRKWIISERDANDLSATSGNGMWCGCGEVSRVKSGSEIFWVVKVPTTTTNASVQIFEILLVAGMDNRAPIPVALVIWNRPSVLKVSAFGTAGCYAPSALHVVPPLAESAEFDAYLEVGIRIRWVLQSRMHTNLLVGPQEFWWYRAPRQIFMIPETAGFFGRVWLPPKDPRRFSKMVSAYSSINIRLIELRDARLSVVTGHAIVIVSIIALLIKYGPTSPPVSSATTSADRMMKEKQVKSSLQYCYEVDITVLGIALIFLYIEQQGLVECSFQFISTNRELCRDGKMIRNYWEHVGVYSGVRIANSKHRERFPYLVRRMLLGYEECQRQKLVGFAAERATLVIRRKTSQKKRKSKKATEPTDSESAVRARGALMASRFGLALCAPQPVARAVISGSTCFGYFEEPPKLTRIRSFRMCVVSSGTRFCEIFHVALDNGYSSVLEKVPRSRTQVGKDAR